MFVFKEAVSSFQIEEWRKSSDPLHVWLDAPKGGERELYFVRGQRDFSERDRTPLELLRPHLSRLRKNAEPRWLAVLEAADGLALDNPRALGASVDLRAGPKARCSASTSTLLLFEARRY